MSFRAELSRSHINLFRAGLRFAREIAYPDLDLESYMGRLDRLAAGARAAVPEDESPTARGIALGRLLFQELGFRGNAATYNDPRNSYLNEVLDRQLGIPITLSVLYVGVARRMDIPADGVGLPGHFIVQVREGRKRTYLDPFNGGVAISREDCVRLVRKTTNYKGAFQQAWLSAISAHDILTRMLNNLKYVYVGQESWSEAVAVLDRLRMVQPDNPGHLRDLGILHFRNGSTQNAAHYLDAFLRRAPDAPDAELVKKSLGPLLVKLALVN
ncbi:MAG: SirB1 family protein [Anaerolineales bacterium]